LPDFLEPHPGGEPETISFWGQANGEEQSSVNSPENVDQPPRQQVPAAQPNDEVVAAPAGGELPVQQQVQDASTGEAAQLEESGDEQTMAAEVDVVEELAEQLTRQREQLQQEEQQLASAITDLGRLLVRLRGEAGQLVVEVALAAAERVLQRQVEADPGWVLENARRCLEHITPNGPLRLHLHPVDRELVMSRDPPPEWLASARNLDLVADGGLQRGDCVLESSRARVDARVAVQLDSLRPLLEEVLVASLAGDAEGEGHG